MLIALLAVLGVNLIVIAGLVAAVFSRRRWLKRQAGEFVGAIRVSSGNVPGFGSKWKRGSGRWVRDVLVWTGPPLMLRNKLIPVDHASVQPLDLVEAVKRLGENPFVVKFAFADATIEVAARQDERTSVIGPFSCDSGSL